MAIALLPAAGHKPEGLRQRSEGTYNVATGQTHVPSIPAIPGFNIYFYGNYPPPASV
jgi:hypothetical protein